MFRIQEFSIYLSFYKNLIEYRLILFALFFLMILEGFTSSISIAMLIPISESLINNNSKDVWLDRYLPKNLINTPFKLFLIFGIIYLFKSIISFAKFFFVMLFAENLRRNWQIKLAYKNLNQPYNEITKIPRGERIENIVKLADVGAMFVLKWLTYTSRLIIVISVFTTITLISPTTSLAIIFILFFIVLAIGKKYFDWSFKLGKLKITLGQKLMSELTSTITALKEIKVLKIEKFKLINLKTIINKVRNVRVKQKIASQSPIYLLEFIISIMVIIFAISLYIFNINISYILPTIIFILGSSFVLISNFVTASTERFKTIANFYAYNFVIKEINLENKIKSKEDQLKLPFKNQDVIFKNIQFSYFDSKKKILNNLNFKIKSGSVIAIYGKSGSGKTTIFDLLIKLYQPTYGEILFNDININKYNNSDWRAKISYVTQEPILFTGTLRENIMLDRKYSDQQILDVCLTANLNDFLKNKDGLDTKIEDNGINLSGGQKRRIAIARSLISDPYLIVIDEATNSLDELSEQNIIKKLKQFKKLTVIIVSHRNVTKHFVDESYELMNGEIFKL
ncbi:ABC transporter ATP-binding protein/permease [Alphaproteobacteria bacterium]|nr:ABC transporter ATP-binding protein/permease [Alphaproteobacteria bacterium]